ncbi:MAG: DNA helicase, partial [Chloroflexota bacterium]|nr:DNA helicase [Chloroflexota bacterium]
VTLLVGSLGFGRQCVDLLEQKGVKCIHVFDDNKRERRNKKHAFYMGAARVKACTIHSFKGWETRTLVVHIANASSAGALAAVYVALSRLKWHAAGSYLTVVCSASNLRAYGQTWPDFVEVR